MFERHPIPTPFPVGPVNAYVAGRTVVDPGPDTDDAWEAVTDALSSHDLAPEDVEQVVLTHAHADHVGLARRFRDHGATILASRVTKRTLADYDATLEREEAFFTDLLPRHGMPATMAETIASFSSVLRSFVDDCEVDRVIGQGDAFQVGSTTVDVDVVSGHAVDELVLSYGTDDGRAAVVGDHVLDHITPNPLLHPPATAADGGTSIGATSPTDGDRPRVLPAFNESLDSLRERAFDSLLPGHGPVVDAPGDRIDAIRRAHEERTIEVDELVTQPVTAYEVMEELFGELPPQELYPGMSEAIGHLDVLEARGEVVATTGTDGTVRYEPVA